MKIHSIFQSVNGEVCSSHQGSVCTFIRLQGCNMRCKWCDTPSSQEIGKGMELSVDEIISILDTLPIPTLNITITGGEPLYQKEAETLIQELHREGYKISLETNGSMSWACLQKYCSIVTDVKPPSSGVVSFLSYLDSLMYKMETLTSSDWVKIPISNQEDFQFALSIRNFLQNKKIEARLAFSPVFPLAPRELFSWIEAEKIGDVVLNVQIHKLISLS